MKKQFYSHLLDVTIIQTELRAFELEPHEHQELIALIHTTIHHGVIDTILSELSEDDQKHFLKNLSDDNHKNIWEHLHMATEEIEEKIRKASSIIIEELRHDLNEVKNSI